MIAKHGSGTFYEREQYSSSRTKNYFPELLKIIVFQQLSGNIADKILGRVYAALEATKDTVTPQCILNAKFEVAQIEVNRKRLHSSDLYFAK